MDAKLLRLFVTLADTLHFAKTAEACHMTPSAVSRAIQRLEQELGQCLFTRDNRSVQLTHAGEVFKRYALESLAQWDALQQNLCLDAKNLSGELRLYCSVTASYSILSAILPAFRQQYPGIEIKLHTGDQAQAVSRVLAGEEDIAIAAHPGELSKKLNFQTVTYSPLHFIAPSMPCQVSRQIEQQGKNGATLDWVQLPLILSEQGLARKRLDQWLKHRGVKPNVYAYVSGHEAIVSMVGLGFGIGVVPELVIQHSPLQDKIKILSVEPKMEPFDIGLCALESRLQSPLVRAFWDMAQESVKAGEG